MRFALTEEQEAIVATTRQFTEKELIPHEERVEKLGAIGERLGLRWGGRFRAPAKPDMGHFEYVTPAPAPRRA